MTPEDFVAHAVRLHLSEDVDAIVDGLFADNISAEFNGQKIANDKEELRAWYTGFYSGIASGFELKKTLRSVDGNTYTVEWHHKRVDPDGVAHEGFAAEVFWLNDEGLLEKWHAHCNEYTETQMAA